MKSDRIEYYRQYYLEHRAAILAAKRKYRLSSKGIAWRRKYAADNKEKLRGYSRAFYRRNPHVARHNARLRQVSQAQRTPAWADLNVIREIYRLCPEGHHVDHVIPLNGKTVSGLHVEYNLQYLTAAENVRKSNRVTLNE